MDTSLLQRGMTRDQFFAWAEAQEERYEFDGFDPVPMTGGTFSHSQIAMAIYRLLHDRLTGSGFTAVGMDAGLATIGDRVRYPDAMISSAPSINPDARLIPDVVVTFEVVSPTSGRMDRIVKPRDYRAVPSILRYVIVERTSIGATVLSRASGDQDWVAKTLLGGEMLPIPEAGIEVPLDAFYEGVALPTAD